MAEKSPTVSIVVPAYNKAPYLAEAIDSVLAQDYPNIELIVLNDGSTDETERVLAQYPADKFYRETHVNMGQSATLNKGWQRSRGTILSYLSADDVLERCAVSRSVEYLHARPEIVMTYCDFYLISAESKVVRHLRTPNFNYRDMVERGVCHPGPGVFFRRTAFELAGPWNVRYRQMPDYDFWLRLGLVGSFQRIPEMLARFRVHADSQTYAPSSFEKSSEPVQILDSYFRRSDLPAPIKSYRNRAMSNAYLTSAQLHWQAGRYAVGLSLALRALHLCPRNLFAPGTAHKALSACAGRIRHGWQRPARPREITGGATT